MAAVMVRPMDVPFTIQATSTSVPIRHVLPSLARLATGASLGALSQLGLGFSGWHDSRGTAG